ncbi:MAG TPA: hypothetical protein VGM86_29710 [Thermoanaerobaculia bacterium]|jgi:tetratricopeptide (TPR) repeat protein
MKDLRILFTAADPGYLAHLVDAEGNRLGVEVPFTPFLEESDYDDLRWYLEEFMELPDGGAVVRARRIEGNFDEWGHKLHDALFTAPENRRYREADYRYDLALSAARQVGDKELVGKILQHQGALVDNQGQFERASHIYQQALQYFQEAGERRSVMLTYNLLGVTEAKAGRLAEARAWFEGSSELALELQDQNCLGQAVQNIGITCRDEGDAARGRGEEVAAGQHFEEALRFGNESLRIKQRYSSKPDEASAWSSLAQIHFRLGDLASADYHAHEARKIREFLDLKEVYKDYDNLSEIAHARGNLDAAAEWAKKRDDLLHELERQGGGGVGLTAQLFKALQALTLACAKAGFEDGGFGPEGDEALGQMAELPVPFSGYVAFLRQIAQGQLPPIPNGLPGEFRQWVEVLVQEIRKAPQ